MTNVFHSPWSASVESSIKTYLHNGKTIAFPTETFYALGGNAFSEGLVERIFQIKQRPRHKPLLLLIDPEWLPQLTAPLPLQTERLMDQFWPGPLTLVLPAHPNLPKFLAGPHHTIAVRHSCSSIVQQLISIGQCPLIGTSANLSDFPENTQPAGVLSQLGSHLDLLIDGGQTPGQNASTIVNTTTSPFQIIRSGSISTTELQSYL